MKTIYSHVLKMWKKYQTQASRCQSLLKSEKKNQSSETKNRGNIKAGPKDIRESRALSSEAPEGTGHVPSLESNQDRFMGTLIKTKQALSKHPENSSTLIPWTVRGGLPGYKSLSHTCYVLTWKNGL